MPESARNTKTAPQFIVALASIISSLEAQDGNSTHVELYSDVAKRLSLMAGKAPAWSWKYMQGVAAGTILPSRKLVAAIYQLADAPFETEDEFITKKVVVRALFPVHPGALVLAASRKCSYPRCMVHFVPVTWNQSRCPKHKGVKIK